MKHILYKTGVDAPGYVIKLSTYLNYYIGRIPDEYDDQRVELKKMNAVIIPEDIAPGFKFADLYKDYLSIRTVSHILDEFPQFANSGELDTEKDK
jgi:hypothetical protein